MTTDERRLLTSIVQSLAICFVGFAAMMTSITVMRQANETRRLSQRVWILEESMRRKADKPVSYRLKNLSIDGPDSGAIQ